jgi:hypothetical protein
LARIDIYEALYDEIRVPQILEHAQASGSALYLSMFSIVSHYIPHLLLDSESILQDRAVDSSYLIPPKLLLGERLFSLKVASIDIGSLDIPDLTLGKSLSLMT